MVEAAPQQQEAQVELEAVGQGPRNREPEPMGSQTLEAVEVAATRRLVTVALAS